MCVHVCGGSDAAAGGAAVGLQEAELLSELCVFSYVQWVSLNTKHIHCPLLYDISAGVCHYVHLIFVGVCVNV